MDQEHGQATQKTHPVVATNMAPMVHRSAPAADGGCACVISPRFKFTI
jgi:hypothetical protein